MQISNPARETLLDVEKRKSPGAQEREGRMLAVYRARQKNLDAAERQRVELAAAIVDLFRTGEYKAAEIGRLVNYTPEHVRRILRAGGIEGDSTRLTPAQRAELRSKDSPAE